MNTSSLSCPPVKDNLITTLNQMGYMMARPDALNQAFIDFAGCCSLPVLEMGCAYGVSVLPVLDQEATVIANDLEQKHLEILKSKVAPKDQPRLHLKPGRIEDLNFEADSLGAVLASRVLNFLHPTQIELSMQRMYHWLQTGGKVFLLFGSPYMGTYAKFLPFYQNHQKEGRPWPGFIEDIRPYTLPERAANLPRMVTLLDLEEVRSLMTQAGFYLEQLAYASVDPDNPDIMKGDGREYVAAIGVKS